MSSEGPVLLLVDDDSKTRKLLGLLLESYGYVAREAGDAEHGLELARARPPDLVLLDIDLPGMSGLDAVRLLKADERTKSVPVIMVTGLSDREIRLAALGHGADDYVLKPVDSAELLVKVRNHLRLKEYADVLVGMNRVLERRVSERTAQLDASYREAIYLLTSAAEYRDELTGAHVKRISYYAHALAERMDLSVDFIAAIYYASPMHDIGKIGIPDSILRKPGPLTPEESAVMKTHTTIGARILSAGSGRYIRMGETIALTHHESWDGSGYPQGLAGEAIPLEGRIVKLCDQYDALRSRRPYKQAIDHARTVEILTQGDGRTRPQELCPEVLQTFLDCQAEFEMIFAQNVEP